MTRISLTVILILFSAANTLAFGVKQISAEPEIKKNGSTGTAIYSSADKSGTNCEIPGTGISRSDRKNRVS